MHGVRLRHAPGDLSGMNAAKTTSERVAKLRADRDALGLKRLELYAHPDDWDKIKACAFVLNMKRTKAAKKRAG